MEQSFEACKWKDPYMFCIFRQLASSVHVPFKRTESHGKTAWPDPVEIHGHQELM